MNCFQASVIATNIRATVKKGAEALFGRCRATREMGREACANA
jgi:hypothetical protein